MEKNIKTTATFGEFIKWYFGLKSTDSIKDNIDDIIEIINTTDFIYNEDEDNFIEDKDFLASLILENEDTVIEFKSIDNIDSIVYFTINNIRYSVQTINPFTK